MTKVLSLDDLLPEKKPIETSIGTLFVRYATVSDEGSLEGQSGSQLGEAALRLLVNRASDKSDRTPITEQDRQALNEHDVQNVAGAIAEICGWGALSSNGGLQELGEVGSAAIAKRKAQLLKSLSGIRSSLGGYSFLRNDTLEKLQKQIVKTTTIPSDSWLEQAINSTRASPAPIEPPAFRYNDLPKPEESPLWVAARDTARNTHSSSESLQELTEQARKFDHLFLADIFPQWTSYAQSTQEDAQRAFQHAQRSLFWTRLALVSSVVVSIATAGWQIWASSASGKQSAAALQESESLRKDQLNRVELLLKEQIELQKKLNESMLKLAKLPPKVVSPPQKIKAKKD